MPSRGGLLLTVALFALFAVIGALARTPAGRVVLPFVSLAVLGAFAYLLTRDAAYARTTVGTRTRLFDTDSPTEGDDDCVACGAPATTTRRFVREFVVLGVPLVLLDDGTNRYCADCLD